MPINEILMKELTGYKNLVEGNSMTGLRAARDFIPTAIAAKQRRLNQLRSTEMLMLQKLRRELTLLTIDGQRADAYMKVEPMQSFLPYDTGNPDPHAYINYDIEKLIRLPVGIWEIVSQQKSIAFEIKSLVADVRDLNNELKRVNDQIAQKRTADVDLEKDRITQRAIAELYAIYEIHTLYRSYTTTDAGTEGFTSDQKIVPTLQNLHLKFLAFAERNPYVLNGSLVLDYEKPGSALNGVALSGLLEKIRQVGNPGESGIVDKKVQKYADNLIKNINDPDLSRGFSRRTESKNRPSNDNSLQQRTATTSKMVQFTQKTAKFWTVWDGRVFVDKATDAFKLRVKALYGGLPFCGSPPKSEEDEKRDTAQEAQKVTATKAAEEVTKSSEAVGVDTTPVTTEYAPAGLDVLDPTPTPEVPEEPTFSDDMKMAASFLRKKPGDVTEADLILGYQQQRFKFKDSQTAFYLIPAKSSTVQDGSGGLTSEEENRLKLIDSLSTSMYDSQERYQTFRATLVEYRTSHGNQATISKGWWSDPVGQPS